MVGWAATQCLHVEQFRNFVLLRSFILHSSRIFIFYVLPLVLGCVVLLPHLNSMTSFHTRPLCINLSPGSIGSSTSGDGVSDEQRRDSTTLTIQCLSELTPLDMMDMSFGIADPTGSCVWLGAFLFMEIFARKLDVDTSYEQRYWSSIRSKIFPKGCHAVELGSGTGMAGLSLMLMSQYVQDDTQNDKAIYTGPSLLVQTDVNDDALELCQINRDANNLGNMKNNERYDVHIKKLEWGKGNAGKVFGCKGENDTTTCSSGREVISLPTIYDVVFATDVLYDLASLVPLVVTASELLKDGGYFILSHVPRASIDDEDDNHVNDEVVDPWEKLETIIIHEASKVDLVLATYPTICEDTNEKIMQTISNEQYKHMILRPALLPHIFGESSSLSSKHSFQKMMDVGASILVFIKKRPL